MTTRSDYTRDEWRAIATLPSRVTWMVIFAGRSGPLQQMQESSAINKALAEAETSTNPLIAEVAAFLREGLSPEETERDVAESVEFHRSETLEQCRTVRAILAARTNAQEADGYKRWVLQLAEATAAAAKEGGFLGIGGTRVTEEERSALAAIADALGLSA